MIPTVETCLRLMDEYRMLDNIKEHSRVVARVAELITTGLRQRGAALDLDLVTAGALLHDIAKTQCLDSRCDHAKVGSALCRELGFSETAVIVAEHVLLRDDGSGRITEKEIVYYADKRVNHDRVVSLHDRLAYILDRYARNDDARQELIRRNFDKCLGVERRVFSALDFKPEQVGMLVSSRRDWRV
jgi:putative nucleotidyltransferase with HDIG domain